MPGRARSLPERRPRGKLASALLDGPAVSSCKRRAPPERDCQERFGLFACYGLFGAIIHCPSSLKHDHGHEFLRRKFRLDDLSCRSLACAPQIHGFPSRGCPPTFQEGEPMKIAILAVAALFAGTVPVAF